MMKRITLDKVTNYMEKQAAGGGGLAKKIALLSLLGGAGMATGAMGGSLLKGYNVIEGYKDHFNNLLKEVDNVLLEELD